jgi:hypothetical protein
MHKSWIFALILVTAFFATQSFALSPTQFTWPNHSGYNLDQILRINKAPDPAFGGFFWSHQFYVGNQKEQDVMYMGLQQQIDGTRSAIISIFYKKTTTVNPDNVKCPLPKARYTACQATQGSGDGSPGAQIIALYPWVEGHDYRLRLWNVEGGWWNYYVMDLKTQIETFLGSIYSQDYPTGRLNPNNISIQWEEVYGGQQAFGNCAYSPQRVVWTSPTMDDLTVSPTDYGFDQTTAPFRIFPEPGNKHYEMLSCPLGGFPMGEYGSSACYYLGEAGKSCSDVCSIKRALPIPQCSQAITYTRDGVASDRVTLPYLGTAKQGGDITKCNSLLALFNLPSAEAGTRINPVEGLGCHVFPPKSWWLIEPPTAASGASPGAERVCGCVP